MVDDLVVVRLAAQGQWEARSSAGSAGRVLAWRRPDRRWFVSFREVASEAYGPLVTNLSRDIGETLYTTVDYTDEHRFEHLCAVGFRPVRRETIYAIAVADALEALGEAGLPDGYVLQNVLEVPESALRQLDDRLRQEVPGTNGWEWDAQGFREETHDSAEFDPGLYWIVAEASTDERVGIVRVWNRPDAPRIGLVAVLPRHRRRGISRALLGTVFRTLRLRGVGSVVTEVDDANEAALGLLIRLGGRRVGALVEMLRPGPGEPVV
jgi:ribosomal protein S18 acetylase RimI-like enzyme